LRYPDSIARAVRDADAVVNLVGLLSESGAQNFDAIHNLGAQAVANAANQAGTKVFVQMSAIGADPHQTAVYGKTKALGEEAVLRLRPDAIVLRPSVVFGPEDEFFNRFAAMARIMPALPLIGGGATRLQPVFVGDVARTIALAVEGKAKPGTTYELGGPQISTFKEIIKFIMKVTGHKRKLLPISFERAKQIGAVTEKIMKISFGLFPDMLAITEDQVELLRNDNVVSAQAIDEGRTLRGLGIAPEAYETFVPTYLYRYRKAGQFSGLGAA
jgi:NADH dehydrogenase